MADYWTQNAKLFRRLYQDERRTLEEVKAIAERHLSPLEHYTISTYEARLRDVLKLRKKLKRHDWYLIHHYALSHGFGCREYDVLLNGTQIRSDRVWKEIRRYGYHKETKCLQGISLPKDVKVRPQQAAITSSSTCSSHILDKETMTRKLARPTITSSSACNSLQTWDAFSAAVAKIDTWTVWDQVSEDHPDEHHEDLDHCQFIELLHDDFPWNRLRVSVLEIMSGKKVAHRWPDSRGHFATYIPNDGFLRMSPGWLVASFATTVYPTTSTLNVLRLPSDLVGMDHLIWYHHFASIAFRLSNTMRWDLKLMDFVEFGTALGLVQPDIIVRIIQGHHLSIRAIWDRFNAELFQVAQLPRFSFFQSKAHMDLNAFMSACVGIVDTILRTHPEWLETQDDANKLLLSCAWLRCKRLVLRLLRSGACITYGEHSQPFCYSALTHAAESGDDELIVALTKNVDMNAFISSPFSNPGSAITHFAHFLLYMFYNIPVLRPSVDVENVYQSLEYILTCGCGVNVDAPSPISLQDSEQITEGKSSLIQSWSEEYEPTCIDAAFYFDRRAFNLMLVHTEQEPDSMTRPGVCEAATAGMQALSSYLNSRTGISAAQISDFLRLILAELLLMQPHTPNRLLDRRRPGLNFSHAKVARGLLQYGVRVNSPMSSPVSQTVLLETCLASIAEHGLTDDLRAILMYFREERIAVRPQTLINCLERQGTNLLDLILDRGIVSAYAIQTHGSEVLRQAVRKRKYDAMFWLIDKGANIPTGDSNCLTIIGELVCSHYDVDQELFSVWRCLVRQGAELKFRPGDNSCAKLLTRFILCADSVDKMLARWSFFEEFPKHLAEVSDLEWRTLLETVLNQERPAERPKLAPWLIEQLFHRAAGADGKPSLLLAIQTHKRELVQMMLSSKADLEERSPRHNLTPLGMAVWIRDFALARQLIHMGTDLNALICRGAQAGGRGRRNTLGEACDQRRWNENEKIEGMRIIRDMIARGATLGEEHVSAAERPWFQFPLHICAFYGTLETATLLLQQHADPNLVMISSFKDEEDEGSPWEYHTHTALDGAACMPRLDMLLLLLKAGGLSSKPGDSGYEGVLISAKERGDRAIVDMVQQHIRNLESEFEMNPERRSQHLHEIDEVREQTQEMLHRARAGAERLRQEGLQYLGW